MKSETWTPVSACQYALRIAEAWMLDAAPHPDQAHPSNPDWFAALQLKQIMERALANPDADLVQAQARIKELEALGHELLGTVLGLAGQQAMPDDFWEPTSRKAERLLPKVAAPPRLPQRKPRNKAEAEKMGWFKDPWGFWVHKDNPDGDGYTAIKDIPAPPHNP